MATVVTWVFEYPGLCRKICQCLTRQGWFDELGDPLLGLLLHRGYETIQFLSHRQCALISQRRRKEASIALAPAVGLRPTLLRKSPPLARGVKAIRSCDKYEGTTKRSLAEVVTVRRTSTGKPLLALREGRFKSLEDKEKTVEALSRHEKKEEQGSGPGAPGAVRSCRCVVRAGKDEVGSGH